MIKVKDIGKFIFATGTTIMFLVLVCSSVYFSLKNAEVSNIIKDLAPVLSTLGLIVGVLSVSLFLFGRSGVITRIENVYSIKFINSSVPSICFVSFGAGGVGKTTLFNTLFENIFINTKKTLSLKEKISDYRYNGKLYSIYRIDYEGQKERVIRDKLRELYRNKDKVQVLFFMFSFLPVIDESNEISNKPNVPADVHERFVLQTSHCKEQMSILNVPIIDDIISYAYGLHSVYVLINQIDLLENFDSERKIDFAYRSFKEVIDRISEIINLHNKNEGKSIEFNICYISAKDGIELDPKTLKYVSLPKLFERIFNREERLNG